MYISNKASWDNSKVSVYISNKAGEDSNSSKVGEDSNSSKVGEASKAGLKAKVVGEVKIKIRVTGVDKTINKPRKTNGEII